MERLLETWWLGLRLAEGLSPAEARQRAGFEGNRDSALPIAKRLVEEGLLVENGERFQLTPRGLPLADFVARRFLTARP